MLSAFFVALCVAAALGQYIPADVEPLIISPLPHTYIQASQLPDEWTWSNVNGTSFLTRVLNQHIPQYCGSCWAHGGASVLADRVKIARKAKGAEINLSIQFILNCGDAGTCHGGSPSKMWNFIHRNGWIPYDTCLPYMACSYDSDEGQCHNNSNLYRCSPLNTCRTCQSGGKCWGIDKFPNATVVEYGPVNGVDEMKAEIFARGPITCGVASDPLHTYHKGIFDNANASRAIDHIISIVGWGKEQGRSYWIVRNSWGEYWGEMGFSRVLMGQNIVGIETPGHCAWVVPGPWTEHNFPCNEGGSNCRPSV